MKNSYKSIIDHLLESTQSTEPMKFMSRLAKVNINYIYKQCINYLYNKIDINYLTTVLEYNGYNLSNKDDLDEMCATVCSDTAYDIFTNIRENINSSNITDETYDDLLAETNLLSDIDNYIRPRIKSILYKKPNSNKPIIDFNTLDFSKKEKIITKILKKLIENDPQKYCVVDLEQNISKINTSRISQNNFLNDFIDQYVKLLISHRSEIINKLVNDTLINLNKILNLRLNANVQNDIEDIIMTNIGDYFEFICYKTFTDEKEIKRLLNKSTKQLQDIKRRVMKAYDNIKEWLKIDYPDLKLYKLTENDIYIYPDREHPEAAAFCSCKNSARKFDFPVEIHISQSIANSNLTNLTKTIYHELIHAIKGQADMAAEINNIRSSEHNKLNNDEYQDIAHNDEIWDQGIDTVRKHTHLDARGYDTNTDITHANVGMLQLKKPHEASIICYRCGWFNVYPQWNNDCTQALNNNFQCPKCHSNDTKLIPAQAGEQQLLEDALAHIHYKVSEQMPYMPQDESRLKKRKEYQNIVQNHKDQKQLVSLIQQQIPNIVTNSYIRQILNENNINLNEYSINDVDEICDTIAGDICYKIFNQIKNSIQSQATYDKFMEQNEYSDILGVIYSHIEPIIIQMLKKE